MKNIWRGLAAMAVVGGTMLFQGCEVDSASDVQRTVGVDFTGFYTNPNEGENITSRNSGTAISSLDLRQGGDRLEAIDNTGRIWTGSLGEFNGTSSSFELNGTTTAGTAGKFSGTISTSGGSSTNSGSASQGTMSGTYIEDGFFATFLARAAIPGATPDDPTPTNSTNSGTNLVFRARLDAQGLVVVERPEGLWFLRGVI